MKTLSGAFLVLLLAYTSTSHAAFVTPTAVYASNGEDTADLLIDGLDLSDDPPTASATHDPGGGMWSVVGSIRAEVTSDLGSAMDLTKVYIWNFNQPGSTERGMKEIEIHVSSDSDPATAAFTAVASVSLEEGGESAQVIEIAATDVRLVKIKGLTNWGHGWSVGLAEIRFESGEIAGNTPFVTMNTPQDGDVIPTGSAIDISATVEDPDDDIAMVEFFDGDTLLGSDDSAPYSYNYANPANGDHTLRVQATDQSGKVAWASATVAVRDVLAGEVIQIDDEADIGEGINQITYSDGWTLAPGNDNDPRFNNNDHYSGNRDNWFEVRFSGAKIDVYATVASHHGTATAQIDGGTEFEISYTADQRGEQVLVWSSPLLPNREHVLRVTVNGTGVVTADRFDVTIPSTRVIQIDDEADIGEGNNQITYSDGWTLAPGNENDPRFNNNDHYSGNRDNWFEIKFTGVKIDLYGTVASHHGTATVSIDGGTEEEISYRADQRGEQVFIWGSPLLPNREHVLRVTVTGDGVVTADRFDVHVPATRIVMVDDEADIGEGNNQITYSDGWTLAPGNENDPRFNNNDHYSGNRDNWFELKFTGVKVDIYGTVASHHGTATVSIDGGTEEEISYRADQRGEQVLIWSSPELPNREHVMRVTVLGTGVVTADRFDIHVSDEASGDLAAVNRIDSSLGSMQIALKDFGESAVDPNSLELQIDGRVVNATVRKDGDTTTLSYAPQTPFAPGSEHRYQIGGVDTNGSVITGEGTFTIPEPPFSLRGLGGPKGRSGNWGVRQIWDAGLVNSLEGSVALSLTARQGDFGGKVHDTFAPVVNFAESTEPGVGFFDDDEPLPAEADGLTPNDFIVIAHGFVRIPSAGDWTIGVHSDEGFALRFIGAPFSAVHGNGVIDEEFPEYMIHPINTTDSNTRGILSGIDAGIYEIEVIFWERGGAAQFEVYAAEGAFEFDEDADNWALVGSPDGLELIGAGEGVMTVTAFSQEGDQWIMDFISPEPDGIHALQQSVDLMDWEPLEADFTSIGDGVIRGVGSPDVDRMRYLRAVLLETPPLYAEDFESGAEGWTAGGVNAADTQWELGTPTAGPDGAFNGDNAYGTDLDDSYAPGALLSLRSPVIDLTGEGRPRLKFQYYIDATEDAEGGRLNFLDETGENLLFNDENLIFWGQSDGWIEYNRPVPTEVRDNRFILEFEFLSDDEEPNGQGWFIDHIRIEK